MYTTKVTTTAEIETKFKVGDKIIGSYEKGTKRQFTITAIGFYPNDLPEDVDRKTVDNYVDRKAVNYTEPIYRMDIEETVSIPTWSFVNSIDYGNFELVPIEPKFKVGDRLRNHYSGKSITVTDIGVYPDDISKAEDNYHKIRDAYVGDSVYLLRNSAWDWQFTNIIDSTHSIMTTWEAIDAAVDNLTEEEAKNIVNDLLDIKHVERGTGSPIDNINWGSLEPVDRVWEYIGSQNDQS